MRHKGLGIPTSAVLLIFLVSSTAFAVRTVPIDDKRIAMSNAIKQAYRIRVTAKGLNYRRRGGVPRAMRASRAAGHAYPVVFLNSNGKLRLGNRLIFRIAIDRNQVKKKPGYVDGYAPAFHKTKLPIGPHTVKLTVSNRETRRPYVVYWGQILVSGGERLSITLTRCQIPARCRATLREGDKVLFGRP